MDRFKKEGIEYRSGDSLACNGLKATVDKYASDVASQLSFGAGDDIKQLVERLGGRIHYESAFMFLDEDATIVVHGPNDFDIALTMLGHTRRDRFTLAHELGHYLLHSKQGKLPMQASRKGSSRIEWEANWFAAGFLMPADDFRDLISKGTDNESIANHFQVSEPAVEIRRKSLGI